MTKKIIILVLITFTLTSCFLVTGEDEKLIMLRKTNTSKKLRLDGYYLRPICNEEKTECNYQIVFFNGNGTTFWVGAFQEEDYKKINSILNSSYLNKVSKVKFNWGIYEIKGDSVLYEKWYHKGKNYAYIKSGTILNDTTFSITSSRRSHYPDEENKDVNETYHFVEFKQKPDSTSIYID